jgi:thiol-disulfide isomerase/thioredoxin
MQEGAVPGFWSGSYETPEGQTLSLSSFQGKPLLVNFWATWCPPCVEEMPLLQSFYQARRSSGWQVLGLAVDQVGPVRAFLARLPMDFPIGMAGLSGVALSRALGNETGGLPFTVVFSPQGEVVHRQIGKLSEADLQRLGGLFP